MMTLFDFSCQFLQFFITENYIIFYIQRVPAPPIFGKIKLKNLSKTFRPPLYIFLKICYNIK